MLRLLQLFIIIFAIHYILRNSFRVVRSKASFPKNDDVFLQLAFSLLAKLALSDNRILKEEIAFIERFMQRDLNLDEKGRIRGIEAFRNAKSSNDTFESVARKIKQLFPDDSAMLENLLEILVCLALADGDIQPNEDHLLNLAASIFGLEFQYLLIRRRLNFYYKRQSNSSSNDQYKESFTDLADEPYRILGLSPKATPAEIKKRYRKLALEHHPDKLIGRGMPKEFIEVATRRFQELQKAYEEICAKRGIH